ncbi:MAG: nucleotidyltransferase domain-containing protein [Anaerolineae bacterium]|nr:nucleotidyltransferase domain-containing protein [Anaerolineae bacterium]
MHLQILSENLDALLKDLPAIGLVYLFGSQVGGFTGPMSDYDFGILVDSTADEEQVRAQFAHRLSGLLQTDRVDVVLLRHAPVELAYHIIAQGRLLYERNIAERVEFESGVLNRHGDYIPVLRNLNSQILQGGEYARRAERYHAALRRTERALGEITATPK